MKALKSLRRIFVSALIVAVAVTVIWLLGRPPSYPPEIVEDGAVLMINFDALHPDLLTFIERMRQKQIVGHHESEFPDVWQNTITEPKTDESDRFVWYYFILPMTLEQQAENKKATATVGGVPCWPMLGVRVDTELSVITSAAVYTQCL